MNRNTLSRGDSHISNDSHVNTGAKDDAGETQGLHSALVVRTCWGVFLGKGGFEGIFSFYMKKRNLWNCETRMEEDMTKK